MQGETKSTYSDEEAMLQAIRMSLGPPVDPKKNPEEIREKRLKNRFSDYLHQNDQLSPHNQHQESKEGTSGVSTVLT